MVNAQDLLCLTNPNMLSLSTLLQPTNFDHKDTDVQYIYEISITFFMKGESGKW